MTTDTQKARERARELSFDELEQISGGKEIGAAITVPSAQKPDGTLTTTCCSGKHYSEIIVVC